MIIKLSFLCLEYVDSEGELQYVDDPKLLPAAAGSLGLLGVITAITYKVNFPVIYAIYPFVIYLLALSIIYNLSLSK